MASRRFVAAILGIGALLAAACAASTASRPNDQRCTPGAYVYCRCEDRKEGTKLCASDGKSFDACKCDGSNPPPTEGDGGVTGPLEPVDAGPPPPGAPKLDPKCDGKIGVVGGSNDDTVAWVAAYLGGGAYTVAKSAGPGVRGPISVLPSNGALVATWASRYMLVAWSKMAASTWSAPVSVGNAVSQSTTSATLLDGDVHLFYRAYDGPFRMGTYRASGWDDATALASAANDGGAPVPGASAPAAATTGSTIALGFTGDDGSLMGLTYTNGAWSAPTKQLVQAYNVPPAIAGIEGAGPKDLLLVYAGSDLLLRATTRDRVLKTWSAPTVVDTAATAIELSLVALPNGGAMLVYLASNDAAYVTTWGSTTGFSAPREMLPGQNPALASAPSLARGACDGDVIVTYAEKGGAVKLLTLRDATARGPYEVPGLRGLTWAAAGELP